MCKELTNFSNLVCRTASDSAQVALPKLGSSVLQHTVRVNKKRLCPKKADRSLPPLLQVQQSKLMLTASQTTFALQRNNRKMIEKRTYSVLLSKTPPAVWEQHFSFTIVCLVTVVSLCQGGCIHVRNGRRGGAGFTLTDDRRVLAGPPKPPVLLPRSRLDSPLLINGALLRHDAPFMFIGCSAVTELFGYIFTDRCEKKAVASLPPLCTDHRPHTPSPTTLYLSARSCSVKGPF